MSYPSLPEIIRSTRVVLKLAADQIHVPEDQRSFRDPELYLAISTLSINVLALAVYLTGRSDYTPEIQEM